MTISSMIADAVPFFGWVATYGNAGLDVTHYTDPQEWAEAMRDAEREWGLDRLDSYTGEIIKGEAAQ